MPANRAGRGDPVKLNNYLVWFSNINYEPESVKVKAENQGNALILAQAKRIKCGLDFTLDHIEVKK
jgi:hypothetical protein